MLLRTWLVHFMAVVGWLLVVENPAVVFAAPRRAKVFIWVESKDDRALVERIQGQVSDLPLDLMVVETEPTLDGANRRIAPDAQALALIWFTRPEQSTDRVLVHAIQLDRRRDLIREVGNGAPSSALGSATLEEAALVVRALLREMTAGESAPAMRSKPSKPSVAPAVPTRERPAKAPGPAAVSFRAGAAWDFVFDGVAAFRRQGPSARLGLTYRKLELSTVWGASLPGTERDAYGSIRLRRYFFAVQAGREWRLGTAFHLNFALRAGAALYAREIEELDAMVSPTPDHTTLSALFGPELRLAWAPAGGPLAFTLTAGVDGVPGAPRIGYEVDSRFEPSLEMWRVQPAFGIGIGFSGDRMR